MTEKPLTEDEARQILANLARNGPPTAQEEAEREATAIPAGFEELYDDEFSVKAEGG